MSSPSADADRNAPTPNPAPVRPARASHLRAVRSPGDEPAATMLQPAAAMLQPAAAPAVDRGSGAGLPLSSSAPRGADNAAYVVVLLVVGAGIAATAIEPSHWLRGVLVMGAGVAIGAFARALLPSRRAGLLAVRGRTFDVICLSALAVLIVTVGLLIPH